MTDKIEKTDEFYERDDSERINSITLGKKLSSPPSCFSEEATAAWKKDVDHYLKMLAGRLAFDADSGYEGPYDIVMDYEYDRIEKTPYLILTLASLSEDGDPQSFRINARRLKRSVEKDREVLIAAHDAKGQFNSESVLQNLDSLKRGYHAGAALILRDEICQSGLSCRYIDFCKDFFALLRVVLPVNEQLNTKLARVYSQTP